MDALHVPAALLAGKWIWVREEKDNQYAQFRQTFEARGGKGVLYVSADSDYAAFLNGELVGFCQFDDHPMNKAYDELSVSFREGENQLSITVWHQSSKGCYSYLPGPAGLLYAAADEEGKALAVSQPGAQAREVNQYQMGDIEPISGQLGDIFHYDASRPDAAWEKAVEAVKRKNTTLYPRPVSRLELKKPIDAKAVKEGHWQPTVTTGTYANICLHADMEAKTGDKFVIYDLGREEAGLLTLKCHGKAGDQLLISWGEHLLTGRVMSEIEGRNFTTCYTLKDGENQFTHYFRRLGGRYLQVMAKGDVEIDYVTVMPTEYPVEVKSGFTCEDPLLKDIYDVCVRTLHLCMHEHYEDTPWREQALYAMDSRNQALCGYYCFGETKFPKSYLHLFREGIRKDHLFELCAHAKERFTIPSFSLSWILAVRDHYLYTGDAENARSLLPTVTNILKGFLDRRISNGLAAMPGTAEYWNFYEWTDGMEDTEIFITQEGDTRPLTVDAALNFYLILALEAAGEIRRWLGESDPYQDVIGELKTRVHQVLFDEEENCYQTHPGQKHYSEFNQSLALLCGLPRDAEKNAALRRKLCDRESGLVPISLSCTLMKYEALLMDRQYDKWVLDNIREKWGAMLAQGATSFWEVEEGACAYEWAGSLCHGWSSVPVVVLSRLLLGVTPTSPGMRTYDFAPNRTVAACGTVPTPWGGIRVENGAVVD